MIYDTVPAHYPGNKIKDSPKKNKIFTLESNNNDDIQALFVFDEEDEESEYVSIRAVRFKKVDQAYELLKIILLVMQKNNNNLSLKLLAGPRKKLPKLRVNSKTKPIEIAKAINRLQDSDKQNVSSSSSSNSSISSSSSSRSSSSSSSRPGSGKGDEGGQPPEPRKRRSNRLAEQNRVGEDSDKTEEDPDKTEEDSDNEGNEGPRRRGSRQKFKRQFLHKRN
jgi:hypothetical protein